MPRWVLFATPFVWAAWLGACSLEQGGSANLPVDGGTAGDGPIEAAPVDGSNGDGADADAEPDAYVGPTFATVAMGPTRACGVTTGGVLKCWGNGQNGGIGDGTEQSRPAPVDVAGVSSATAIAVGLDHTCALDASGGIKCWGANDQGQLGDGTNQPHASPTTVPSLTSGVTAIVAGDFHTCALTAGGGVKCWGQNDLGQLGDTTAFDRGTPGDVSGLTADVVAIAAAGSHTCALTKTGGMKCWGEGGSGQNGDNSVQDEDTPQDVQGLTSGVAAIGVGAQHSCAVLTTGAMKCWGANDSGQLGDGTKTTHKIPFDVTSLPGKAVAVTGGAAHTCARMEDGSLQCWGEGALGQLGDGSTAARVKPGAASVGGRTVQASAGGDSTCARLDTGRVRCWGDNTEGQLGDGRGFTVTAVDVPSAGADATSLSLGSHRACVLKPNSVVTCFGDDAAAATVTGLGNGVSAISVGNDHACANVGGALKCWGGNAHGQLGNNTVTAQTMPVQVTSITSGASFVTAGGEFTCATLGTGAAKCWGKNDFGQVGDNSKTDRHTPVDVYGLTTGVVSIDTSSRAFACAVVTGGALECWGDAYGQTPYLLSTSIGATTVAVGSDSACVVLTGKTVSCWGNNDRGQLGNGTTYTNTYPVAVTGLSNVIAFDVGSQHACAVVSGGTVKCWGANDGGQLGDGTTLDRTTPVDVVGVTGAIDVSTGGSFSCALLTGGKLKCWGRAEHCQLGECIPRGPVDLAIP